MYDITKLLRKNHFNRLLNLLPSPKQKKRGRKRVKKEALLNGILQVLVNGVAWGKIADCGCGYASCFRYFKELQRRGNLKLIYQILAFAKTDITNGSIDATTVTSFEFRSMAGWNGHKKVVGTKVSLFADKNGLPADVDFGKGSDNDKKFLSHHIENTVGKPKKTLNLDMLYMNLSFRREMRRKGIRVNMKCRKQDFTRKRGHKFKLDWEKYKVRFLVERTNAWIKNFRCLRIRREYNIAMFKAFVYLALILISDKIFLILKWVRKVKPRLTPRQTWLSRLTATRCNSLAT